MSRGLPQKARIGGWWLEGSRNLLGCETIDALSYTQFCNAVGRERSPDLLIRLRQILIKVVVAEFTLLISYLNLR